MRKIKIEKSKMDTIEKGASISDKGLIGLGVCVVIAIIGYQNPGCGLIGLFFGTMIFALLLS